MTPSAEDRTPGLDAARVDVGVPEALPRFNWGAFLAAPVWGVAHGQWAGVFFLPAWAFVDNVVRGPRAFGVWSLVLGWGMAAATLALQVAYAANANRVAWHRSRGTLDVARYLRAERVWAIGGAIIALGMAVWIYAYIARYGVALAG